MAEVDEGRADGDVEILLDIDFDLMSSLSDNLLLFHISQERKKTLM